MIILYRWQLDRKNSWLTKIQSRFNSLSIYIYSQVTKSVWFIFTFLHKTPIFFLFYISMSNGNNNTLVLFDNITAQDLLSKAKVWMIILINENTRLFVDIYFLFTPSEEKKNLSVMYRRKREGNERKWDRFNWRIDCTSITTFFRILLTLYTKYNEIVTEV